MTESEQKVAEFFNQMAKELHADQRRAGHYKSPSVPISFPETYEKLALMGTEVSELIKAFHKDEPAQHIPGYSGEEEECADVILRALDYAGARGLRIGQALVAKIKANEQRGYQYGNAQPVVPSTPRRIRKVAGQRPE